MRAAFDGEFIEGRTKTYRLEDTEPSAFRLFVKYLYSERLEVQDEEYADDGAAKEGDATAEDAETDEDDEDDEDDRSRDLEFAQLWVLGDRLLMPRLQNQVMWTWNKLWASKCGIFAFVGMCMQERIFFEHPCLSWILHQSTGSYISVVPF